jgi:2-hydroxycyclohexanecarboxyl-CoA dehydrogenase
LDVNLTGTFHCIQSAAFPGVAAIGMMTPVGRAGVPADVAAACAFLCSDDAGFITGQQIGANGGFYLWPDSRDQRSIHST